MGPGTDPCGTPNVKSCFINTWFSMRTDCVLFWRSCETKMNQCSTSIRTSWFPLSNPLHRPRSDIKDNFFLSILLYNLSDSKVVLVERADPKLCWVSFKRLLMSKYSVGKLLSKYFFQDLRQYGEQRWGAAIPTMVFITWLMDENNDGMFPCCRYDTSYNKRINYASWMRYYDREWDFLKSERDLIRAIRVSVLHVFYD